MRSRLRLAGTSVVLGSLLLMAPHADADWRIAGQIGGPVSAIAADSSLMYLGVGFRLHVYDVSDPASPREVGSTNAFGDFVSDIAIAGSRAYVTAGRSGLHIIDTADASNPRTIGRWDSPGSAESVTVVGARAYVADGFSGVSIVDVSDPRTPALRSTFFDTYFAFDVAVDGRHAFIAGAGAGLLVADINDPANPRPMAIVDTPGYARAIALSATTLYLADEWGGVRIVNVTDPVRPREIGSIAVQGWAFDVTAAKSIIHVAAGSSGFQVYDATDAEHPRLLSSYDVPWSLSWKIAPSPTRAFVAMRTQGVAIFDVRNPGALQRLGSVSPLSNAQAVAARGSLAFVATESQGMRIVDFSDPARPRERGRGGTEDFVSAIAADESRVYTCEGKPPTAFLRVFDFADPDRPNRLASAKIIEGSCRDLALQGTSLYFPDEFGLAIWDVSNPAAPAMSGMLRFPGSGVDKTAGVEAIDLSGQTAIVDTERGVATIDVTDPRNPRLLGSWSGDWLIFDVSLEGQFAYAISGIPFPEITVIDIKDPARPVRLGSTSLPAPGQRVIVRDKKAYVAVGPAGIAIIDVSNPAAPISTTRVALPGFAKELVFAGDRLLVATSDAGLFILEQTTGVSSMTSWRHVPRRAPAVEPAVTATKIAAPMLPSNQRPPVTTAGRAITVTSSADSGTGTLREVLTALQPGDSITFDVAVFPRNSPTTIRPQSVFPVIQRDGVVIDASNAGVIIDGSALSGRFEAGLEIASKGNTIKGLRIIEFPFVGIFIRGNGGNTIDRNVISRNREAGVFIANPNRNRVVGNLIGTDATGRQGLGRQQIGVNVFYQPGNGTETGPDLIGGTDPGDANVIAGNDGAEVYLHNGRGIAVIGNYLGTDATGSMRVGSCPNAIATSFAAGNVISGNVMVGEQQGIFIIDPGSHCNLVANNWIGVSKTGIPLTNQPYANSVAVYEPFNAVVGNTMLTGMSINNFRGNPAEVVVIGNKIGRDVLPPNPPGQQAGVVIATAWRTFIGGPTPAERNVITGNTTGIWIRTPGLDQTFIVGNTIRASVVGIDLGLASSSVVRDNTITENQQGVSVAGPTNQLRRNSIYGNTVVAVSIDASASGIPQPPRLTEVTLTTVRGTACGGCAVDIYSDAGSQARWYEGTTTADAVGFFNFKKPTILRGPNVTAASTDAAGSTSAFSTPVAAPPPPPRRRAIH